MANSLIGLMFWRKTPVTFKWGNLAIRGIHSFLCRPFIAIYWNGNNVVEVKVVEPNQWNVKTSLPFDKLEEIPI